MLDDLKDRVYKANIALEKTGLVILTWGNVSEIDRNSGYVAIKPSGVAYSRMTRSDIVITDLDGNVIEGKLKPSSDLATHLEIYRNFPEINGITHTHSSWATIFAQCGRAINPLGTTHADTFYGEVPCTRKLTPNEIKSDYEANTGKVICECVLNTFDKVPAVLVHSHGPFTWGKDAAQSVENAVILEQTAMMAWHTLMMSKEQTFQQELLDKHYLRKHGKDAYYGQGR